MIICQLYHNSMVSLLYYWTFKIIIQGGIHMENKIEEMPIEVKALEDFLLYIKFQNGEEKIYFNSIPVQEFNSEIKEME